MTALCRIPGIRQLVSDDCNRCIVDVEVGTLNARYRHLAATRHRMGRARCRSSSKFSLRLVSDIHHRTDSVSGHSKLSLGFPYTHWVQSAKSFELLPCNVRGSLMLVFRHCPALLSESPTGFTKERPSSCGRACVPTYTKLQMTVTAEPNKPPAAASLFSRRGDVCERRDGLSSKGSSI